MDYIYNVFLSSLNTVVHNGGFIRVSPDTQWHIDWHRFNQNKFYYITKGSLKISIENQNYTAGEGDWFFIPANTLHYYENNFDTGFEKYWIHFDIYPAQTDLFKLLHLPYIIHTKKDRKTIGLFSQYEKSDSSTITGTLEQKACVLQLLSHYIALSQPQKVGIKTETDVRIENILKYINENLDKDLSNEVLSKMCYLHPNHFIRFFKSKTNRTPASYVKQCRLETAKRLLENPDLRITEVASKVGIDDISLFSKQFKMFFSISPREYRKYYQFHLQTAEKQVEDDDICPEYP